jgi:GTPase SAR1 family protein
MRITEEINPHSGIEVCKMDTDRKFQWVDKNKSHVASWIDKTPFWNKNHVLVLSGAAGSGKTTTSISLISSMKHRVYAGVFDMVIICAPESTLKSLSKSPFEGLPDSQIFHKFDEEFLDFVFETVEINSLENKDTLVWVDDAASALKTNRRIQDKFSNLVMKHRHLKTTIHLLCQDLIQVPLSIRENISGVINFRPINCKRMRLFHEEYLGNITYKEFLELNKFVYKKKGDFLFIKMTTPRKFFKCTNEIFFQGEDNGEEEKNNKNEKN